MFGLGRGLKLAELLATSVLFLSTTKVEEFTAGLARLGVPYRVGFAITLAFRLVPLFIDSALTVVQAQSLRGYDFNRGGPLERVRRYVPVIDPGFHGRAAQGQQHGDGAGGARLRDAAASRPASSTTRRAARRRGDSSALFALGDLLLHDLLHRLRRDFAQVTLARTARRAWAARARVLTSPEQRRRMLFVIIGHDGPNGARAAAHCSPRPSGIPAARWSKAARCLSAGPFTDGSGSLIVVDLESEAAARAFARNDPYATRGVFERVEVKPFRKVLPE